MQNGVKTHCPRGHEYTPENTRIGQPRLRPNGKLYPGARLCKACVRLASIRHRPDRATATRRYRAFRRKQLANGLCPMCAKPAIDGCQLCEYHRDLRRAKRLRQNADKPGAIRNRRIAHGLCSFCEDDTPSVRDHRCEYHLQLQREIAALQLKEWHREHPEYNYTDERRQAINEWRARRKLTDPAFAIMERLRRRITKAISDRGTGRKMKTTAELIGCTIPELMAHIESKFKPGMTWENRDFWHVDHVRPIKAFNLTKLKDQKACFNWKNLQPLWAEENFRKHAKFAA